MKNLLILLVILSAAGCYDEDDICYLNYFQNVTDYKVAPDTHTPSGVAVDTGNGLYEIDLKELDGRLSKIESCLQDVMEELPDLSKEEIDGWQCIRDGFGKREALKRQCLVIKLVRPVYGSCSDYQMIEATVEPNPSLCEDKGLPPTPDCPCRWRTAIQDENTIITPPEETRPDIAPTIPPAPYLWELGRMMTSCNNVWASPFAKCLSF